MKWGLVLLPLTAATLGFGSAQAKQWAKMPAQQSVSVAKEGMVIAPPGDWNRSSLRPSPRGESWTRDGIALNELTFFAAIDDGEAVLRSGYEAEGKLPRFRSNMLPTDLVDLFEKTNRAILQSAVFTVELTEPARIGAHDGVRFRYSYAVQNEDLLRRGEAVAAVVDGKLYIINFVAPALYYFDRDIDEVRKIVAGAKIVPPAAKP